MTWILYDLNFTQVSELMVLFISLMDLIASVLVCGCASNI